MLPARSTPSDPLETEVMGEFSANEAATLEASSLREPGHFEGPAYLDGTTIDLCRTQSASAESTPNSTRTKEWLL